MASEIGERGKENTALKRAYFGRMPAPGDGREPIRVTKAGVLAHNMGSIRTSPALTAHSDGWGWARSSSLQAGLFGVVSADRTCNGPHGFPVGAVQLGQPFRRLVRPHPSPNVGFQFVECQALGQRQGFQTLPCAVQHEFPAGTRIVAAANTSGSRIHILSVMAEPSPWSLASHRWSRPGNLRRRVPSPLSCTKIFNRPSRVSAVSAI